MSDELHNDTYTRETRLIYGRGHSEKWDYAHHVIPPISSSATYRLDSAQRGAQGFIEFAHTTEDTRSKAPIYIYDRLGEPNKDILEENLAFAENGDAAITFASGMAAISAVFGILLKSGEQIIAHPTLYGCTYSLLTLWYPRYNIDVVFQNMHDIDALASAITEKTRVIFFESPINPTMGLIDIPAITKLVAKANVGREEHEKIRVVVDNTFATPFCQRPIELGADFVMHSLTKGIGGFGTDMGGVIVCPKQYYDMMLMYRKDFGGVLATKSAWPILVYGLPTLSLRVRREMESALIVASWLEQHPKVKEMRYPGLPSHPQYELAQRQMRDFDGNFAPGTLMYFTLQADTPQESRDKGERFINTVAANAYTITLAVSLGHLRTLIEHPGSMTHSAIPAEEQVKRGMDPGGIRLSIGIEHPDDIIRDLADALATL
ncbi:MAG: aminotransferase class I/II-fold pyridoxal phosphate-dependent enzyme [Ignavibacteriae bacterium]|nr:aminotransferase class I/II-fold pyridoxal phosphate-dependent enzyme [Ignavibacteriota bacterium]